MNYKHLSLLISLIFIMSFVSMAVCAHPGHGSEYIEEVPSSQPEPSSQVSNSYSEPVYSSDSEESSSSAPSSSSSFGAGLYAEVRKWLLPSRRIFPSYLKIGRNCSLASAVNSVYK